MAAHSGKDKPFSDLLRTCPYRLEDFDYTLPAELIAQSPCAERDGSRLLVADRRNRRVEDKRFVDVAGYFLPGDLLVLNNTRVFPARLFGRKSTGGKAEVLLIGAAEDAPPLWKVLIRPSPKTGQRYFLGDSGVEAICKGRGRDGHALLEFLTDDVLGFAEREGRMPLPPYIRRPPDDGDRERYQTVYAKKTGAVAAPTAGLHFTPGILDSLKAKGVRIAEVTLHVGHGTFQPVRDIERHRMHAEYFECPDATACCVNETLASGRKVWACGTTAVRVLETCSLGRKLIGGSGWTDLFIAPPSQFDVVGGLVTNFHLPRSTLLMLVSAFMGHEWMKEAYRHAVEQQYRFYSYGDAMLIV